MSEDYNYGACGVFCEQCPAGNGVINRLAKELKRLTAGFGRDFPDQKQFDFKEYTKALEHFGELYGCPGCWNHSEAWCEVKKCEKINELKSCLLCDDLKECPRTEYQRERYPYVLEHQDRVREVGIDQYFCEEREKAKKGTLSTI
jgi:hypothetical protein